MATNNNILFKKSSVPGKVPTIESLQLGELALNTADGKAYFKKTNDTLAELYEYILPPATSQSLGGIKVGTGLAVDINGVVSSQASAPYFSDIVNKPTTLSGYGITDAQAQDADLTAIAGLTGTSGLLKKTAADTWTLDTTAYTTNTGTVTSVSGTGSYGGLTLSGTVTGSGSLTLGGTPTGSWPISVTGSSASTTGNAATATKLATARTINGVSFDGTANITVADSTKVVANSAITAGTGTKITYDAKGLVTGSTTLSASDIPTLNQNTTGSAGSVVNSQTIKFDTGTTEGTDLYTFNGSSAKTVDIKAGTNVTLTKAAGTITISANDPSVAIGEITGLATGASTFLATPSSANLAALLTDETGTGANVFATSPTLVTPNIGVATGTSFNSITGLSSTTPVMNGTAAVGTGTTAARADHVHATDTSRMSNSQALAITGDVTAASTALNTGTIATTLASVGTAGTYTKVTTDAKGRVTSGTTLSASDIPSLDASKITSGTIDAARLPSYVDDVIEGTNLASFPATGETGKIYVALDTNKTYRWSGSAYVYITSGAVDSVAGKTGVVTLVKGDVGLGSVDNTADSAKNVLSATKLTTARTINGVSFDGTANITITDSTKQPLDADLTAIAGLTGTTGLLKKTAADTWTLDTNAYVTSSGVTSVTGTAPIVSSGGTTPAISISAATTSAAGSMSAADKTKLDGIATGATANTGTVTSVGGTGSYGGLTLSGTVTTSGNLTLGGTPTGTWPISVSGSSASCSGNAATATTATNQSGGTVNATTGSFSTHVQATGTGNDYYTGGVELIGNGTSNTVFPNIGFHQPGLYASSLQLRGGGDFRFYAQGAGSYANVTAATFYGALSGGTVSATTGTFSGAVSVLSLTETSDRNFKDNIATLETGLIDSIRPVSFNWKDGGKKAYGVIAQELEEVVPEAVVTSEEGIKSVQYTQLIPLLIAEVQALRNEINILKGAK